MNQNIKSFDEFKEIYIQKDFQDKIKELYELKKKYRKFVIYMLISVILICFSLTFSIIGLLIATIMIIAIGKVLFGKEKVTDYTKRYKLELPYLIAKLSEIKLITREIDQNEYFKEMNEKKGTVEQVRYAMKASKEYEQNQKNKIKELNELNTRQFKESHLIEADEYYTSNIARFIHQNTNTTIDLYQASAYKVKYRVYKEENQNENEDEDEEKVQRIEKLINNGLVLSIDNLENIKLNDMTILIKNDDNILSHISENTVDNLKNTKNEIKFNRIDLNKSFDCFLISDSKKNNEDFKVEALKILTPVVEDLLSYIRKKYGKFNLAINKNKIDIELLDMNIIGNKNVKHKNVFIHPKIFSNKDLKISYLYRFYELIEIQKLILKYLNCYPEKYLITDDDVNGLREAIESNKLSDYEMDKTVEQYYQEIF